MNRNAAPLPAPLDLPAEADDDEPVLVRDDAPPSQPSGVDVAPAWPHGGVLADPRFAMRARWPLQDGEAVFRGRIACGHPAPHIIGRIAGDGRSYSVRIPPECVLWLAIGLLTEHADDLQRRRAAKNASRRRTRRRADGGEAPTAAAKNASSNDHESNGSKKGSPQ